MLKVMEKRRTVREYDETPLNEKMMKDIQDILESMPIFAGTEDVDFTVLENGETVFQALDGIAGYNGHLIEAPHYFLVTCAGSDRDYQVVGYLGEWLALHLAKIDIGTCWLTSNDKSDLIKERLGLEMVDEVAALIAFGEPKEDKKLSKIYEFGATTLEQSSKQFSDSEGSIKDENYAYRKAITELVYLKTFGTELEPGEIDKRGLGEVFYYMRNAPSWGNLQPWKFILDGERIVLIMEKNASITTDIQNIDAGIAMLYFEVAMHDSGLSGKWITDVDNFKTRLCIPDTYEIIGYYGL
jgi:nitroreductase